jgi:hypothetical protein
MLHKKSYSIRRTQRRQLGLGRLKKNIELIRVLGDQRQPLKLRTAIARNAPVELIECVSDCCRNVLNGRVKLTPARKRQLATHCNALRLLANPKVGAGRKRILIARQRGGFWIPFLAAIIPSIVQQLISHFGSGYGRRGG